MLTSTNSLLKINENNGNEMLIIEPDQNYSRQQPAVLTIKLREC